MILDTIIIINVKLLMTIIELFPSADISVLSYIQSNLSGLKSALSSLNWFFPVDQLFLVLGYIFVIETISLFSKVLFWITENVSLGIFKAPR